jgi:hypothetical protein
MGKKNNKCAKRSLGSTPKGLIRKGNISDPGNPFEITAPQKCPKHLLVHNHPLARPKSTNHALESLWRRQTQLRSSLASTKKANVFVDRRIGQYDTSMTHEDQMFARLVEERSRQSRKTSKFQLDDDENDDARHNGKKLDPNKRGNRRDDQLDGSIDCISGLVDNLFVFFFFVSSSFAPVAVGTTKCHAPKMLVERLATAHSQTAGGRSDFRIAIVGTSSRYHHHHPNLYPSERSNVHDIWRAFTVPRTVILHIESQTSLQFFGEFCTFFGRILYVFAQLLVPLLHPPGTEFCAT